MYVIISCLNCYSLAVHYFMLFYVLSLSAFVTYSVLNTGILKYRSPRDILKPVHDCRRKRRLSQKSATVAEFDKINEPPKFPRLEQPSSACSMAIPDHVARSIGFLSAIGA